MKIVNFIGSYDKIELIIYIAKVVKLTQNAKVLVIDSFATQKTRCIIPALVNDEKYITTFEEIDIAVGFEDQKEIVKYLKKNEEEFTEYDYVFIDMNTSQMCNNFDSENPNITFAITSYDKFEILKTVGLINEYTEGRKEFTKDAKVNRVYVYSLLNISDEKYINFSFNDLKIKWSEKNIYLPLDEGDKSVLIQNQYSEKLKFSGLSKGFKNGIIEMTASILEDVSKQLIIKTFKNIERSV